MSLQKTETRESLAQAADKLVSSVRELAKTANTEEELRIGFEKLLEPSLKSIRVQTRPKNTDQKGENYVRGIGSFHG